MTEKEYKNYIYEEIKTAHPDVIKHWKKIVKGKVPFGYKVKE